MRQRETPDIERASDGAKEGPHTGRCTYRSVATVHRIRLRMLGVYNPERRCEVLCVVSYHWVSESVS